MRKPAPPDHLSAPTGWRASIASLLPAAGAAGALATWLVLRECDSPRLDQLDAVDRRVVVVFADGLDRAGLQQLRSCASSPLLRARLAGGVVADVAGEPPTAADRVRNYATLITGVLPASHGMLASTHRDERDLAERPTSSFDAHVPSVCDLLSAVGVECLIVGAPATWPARWIRGAVVSDRFFAERAHHVGATPPEHLTFPESLAAELASTRPSSATALPRPDSALAGLALAADDPETLHAATVADVARIDAEIVDATGALLRQRPSTRLVVVAIGTLDAVSRSARPDTEAALAAQRWFECCLVRLCEVAGKDATLLLVSTYGREPATAVERVLSLQPLLERAGLCVRDARGAVDRDASVCVEEPAPPASADRRLLLARPPTDRGGNPQAWEPIERRLALLRVRTTGGDPAPLLRFDDDASGRARLVHVELPRRGSFVLQGPAGPLPPDALFPTIRRAQWPCSPGVVLLCEPEAADAAERAQRCAPLGQSPAASTQVAPTLLALFGLPAPGTLEHRRRDDAGPAEMSGRPLYWMFDREFAECVSPRRLDYASRFLRSGPAAERDAALAAERP